MAQPPVNVAEHANVAARCRLTPQKKVNWILLCFHRFLLFQDWICMMHLLFAKADRLSGEVIGDAEKHHTRLSP